MSRVRRTGQWFQLLAVGGALVIVGCHDSRATTYRTPASGGSAGFGGGLGGGGTGGISFDIFPGGAGGVDPNYCEEIVWHAFREKDAGADGSPGGSERPDSGTPLDGGSPVNAARPEAAAGVDARCHLPLSFPNPTSVQYDRVSVTFEVEGSFQGFIPWAPSCDLDSGIMGFIYDNAESPNEIVLCPDTCDRFTKERASVTVHVTCREYANPW
jgi:hypothetical protein